MERSAARVYPVVHVETTDQVLRDVETAEACGLHHVFLIHHGADDVQLALAAKAVQDRFADIQVGVNVIRRPAQEAMRVLASELGSLDHVWSIWTDTLGLESNRDPQRSREAIEAARTAYDWDRTIFGGVAFEYQQPVDDHDLPALARAAAAFSNVVPTTSGKGTGTAPSTAKLGLLRQGVPYGRLACASGVTPENFTQFTPFVTDILVSTGVSDSEGRLSDERVRRLFEALGSDLRSN